MEIAFTVINVVAFIGLGWFIKNYMPSYMNKKGENLATKEDIAEITRKTEEVTTVFQREMAVFSNELNFTNDFSFNRYSVLYSRVYGIVIQSEYLRFFYNKHQNQNYSIEEYPFIELSRNKLKQKTEMFTNRITSETVESINDEVTSFNRKELCDFIIKNSEYASPKLLKLAIAYRYVSSSYGNKNTENESLSTSFNSAEFALIKEIIKTIIMEYNEMRKIVNLSYSEHELEKGELEHTDFR